MINEITREEYDLKYKKFTYPNIDITTDEYEDYNILTLVYDNSSLQEGKK